MYVFDEEIIHDKDTMWWLALDFKVCYEIWSKQLEKIKESDYCMNYDGVLIFKHRDEKLFKKAVSDYKQRVRVLELIIKKDFEDERHGKFKKYVSEKTNNISEGQS